MLYLIANFLDILSMHSEFSAVNVTLVFFPPAGKTEWKTNTRMRNLNLLLALKFHSTTKMEFMEEIHRIRDDRLDF